MPRKSQQRELRRSLLGGLLLLASPLVLRAAAVAQVLPLVTEEVGSTSAFWWAEPESRRATSLDDLLVEALGDRLLDPTSIADPPSVSRLYRVPELSDAAARNLAGLYGASHALVGRLSLPEAEPTAGDIGWVVAGELEYRLLSVATEVIAAEGRSSVMGVGPTPQQALADARGRAAAGLTDAVTSATAGNASLDPEDAVMPTLVVRELTSAEPLVALMSELRARSDRVADLREVWATEGAIALEIDLQAGVPPAALDILLTELALSEDWPFLPEVLGREGLTTTLRLVERP